MKINYGKTTCLVFLALIAVILLVSALAGRLAPHDPLLVNYSVALQPPSADYPFGTDDFGRCILSRVLHGLNSSVYMSLFIVAVCTVFGGALGLIAGYYGGIIDNVIMRITDMFLAFPNMVISIAIVGVLGAGWRNTAIALIVPSWLVFARLSRCLALSIKEKDYLKSAKAAGLRADQILIRYVAPNMLPQIMTISAIEVGGTIISFCALAFLGLGAQPPQPELGLMLNEAKTKMQIAPWMLLFPALSVFIVVILFNLLSDSLRDVLDPSGGGGNMKGYAK